MTQVHGYQFTRGYDYQNARRRLIFEGLTQGVQYVFNNAVEGGIAEFGTGSGFSALTIAHAMNFYARMYAGYQKQQGLGPKTLHLFDSFKGLPRPDDPVDLQSPYVVSGRWKEGTFTALTRDELLAMCSAAYEGSHIRIAAGWFSETLPAIPAGAKFAMLHLDCDLYSSTVEVLDHLFGHAHVAEGAILFFDDWNSNRSSPKLGQRKAWREMVEKHRIDYSDGGDHAVIGHKFIVHMER
jgi:hypothetical protein